MHGDIFEKFIKKGKYIDFASNINPFKPKDLRSKLIEAVERAYFYPENSYEELRQTIANSMKWDYKEVVFGNGSIELIEFFFRVVRGRIVIAQPTFTEYSRFAKIYGSEVIDARYDTHSVIDAIKREKPDGLVICSPNNPTGDLIGKDEMDEIVEICEKYKVQLLLDQAFIDFVKPYDVEAFQIRSLTKILGIPGIRFGYGKFPIEYAEMFEERRIPWNVNGIAVALANYYLPKLKAISRNVRRKIKSERRHLSKALSKLSISSYGEANFLLCNSHFNSNELFDYMLSNGIIIRKCSDFKWLNENFFRIAVRKREENRILLKKLEVFVEENS